MGFQQIPKIENARFYVNLAFKHANECAKKARMDVSKKRSVIEKSKIIEIAKMRGAKDFLISTLERVIKNFPNISHMPRFYIELLKCQTDIGELRKSLGALKWAGNKISEFFIFYKGKIKKTKEFSKVNEYRTMFYGRVASAMRQIDKNLRVIEEARKIMKDFPVIKENIFTVAIAGFPNVGKSTLLAKLTGAKPEIADYAFTTKSLNIGYIVKDGKRIIQLIDTPGTLNRFDRMNNIEKQAYIAMKYASDIIVYVFDAAGTYPIKEQEKLLERIKRETGKDVIVYVSKTDVKEIEKNGIRKIKELRQYLLHLQSKICCH